MYTIHQKKYSKWIKYLNVKYETLKENMEELFYKFTLGEKILLTIMYLGTIRENGYI